VVTVATCAGDVDVQVRARVRPDTVLVMVVTWPEELAVKRSA